MLRIRQSGGQPIGYFARHIWRDRRIGAGKFVDEITQVFGFVVNNRAVLIGLLGALLVGRFR